VLASAIDGSIGLLGDDYPGLFPLGDADALAALVSQAQDDPTFLTTLREHGRRRALLFAPQREAQAVRALVRELLERPGAQSRHGLSPTV
jgi:glycosyltransferase involved in cell wall biosynthesis